MRLEDFFLICFGVGTSLGLISFLAGRFNLHLPHKFHVPKIGKGVPHGTGSHGGVGKGIAKGGTSGQDAGVAVDFTQISPFNFPSLMMFVAWFGGIGYLASHNYGIGLFMALLAATAGGIFGGGII